ncbi:MAG: hypothetical protein WBB64_12460 [Anaerolineales bacterium]
MMKPESLSLTLSIADRLKAYLTDCLKKWIKCGEFNQAPVSETVNLLIAMINGLTRQRGFHPEEKDGMRDVDSRFLSQNPCLPQADLSRID